MEIVKIPLERISSLIGTNHEAKDEVEKVCNVKLEISQEGEVEISGEVADIYFAKDVVKAIGRGFGVRDALRIIKNDCQFYLISLKDYSRNEKGITRLKSRVIGEEGKVKLEIESATESRLSIYGNTVGIIAKIDTMEYAKQAVDMILTGSTHIAVFEYLSKIRRKIIGERLLG
ncbi:MAG: KH domain-containing protein [Candidatus Micrarchaeota archaeon]